MKKPIMEEKIRATNLTQGRVVSNKPGTLTQQQNKSLPLPSQPYTSKKQPEYNPLAFNYKGVDKGVDKGSRRG